MLRPATALYNNYAYDSRALWLALSLPIAFQVQSIAAAAESVCPYELPY